MDPKPLTPAGRPIPIPLRLETDDLQVAFDLLSANTSLQPGVELDAPGGAKVRFRNRVRKGPGTPTGRLDFELLHASPASVEPLASWLHRCLQGRLPRATIGRQAVPMTLEALRQALAKAVGGAMGRGVA